MRRINQSDFVSLFLVSALFLGIILQGCSRNTLSFGHKTLVTEGRSYRIGDVQIKILHIAVRLGVDGNGNENEHLNMTIQVGARDVSLTDDLQVEVDGMLFTASAAGYRWGASPATATLRVDRK